MTTTPQLFTGDGAEDSQTKQKPNSDYDRKLLTSLKEGDEDAFMEVFRRWEKPLYYFLLNIIGSQQDAEDISQEAFATLWINHATIDPSKNIKTYIFLIAKQIAWKHLRSQRREGGFMSDVELEVGATDPSDEVIVAKEMELLIEYAIAKMPARTQEIYNMHYKENLTYEQIAEKLNISKVNVTSQIYQARQKLKDILLIATLLFFS